MCTLYWFKRDLRLQDSPGLTAAARFGAPVLPVYIVEPELWAQPDASARQWAFLAECLDALRREVPLVIGVGDAVAELSRLVRRHGVTRIVSHEETGNLWTYARDRRVAAWARAQGLEWRELPQSGVVRRLASRNGWAKQREAYTRAEALSAPQVDWVRGDGAQALPSARDLGLDPDGIADRQPGGRRAALSCLVGFLTERGRTYRRAMSSPGAGAEACSRLSPYLALGVLSGREVAQATRARQAEVSGTRDGWVGALRSFQSRLAWRDHFMQKLEDQPRIESHCLHPAYEGLRPTVPDATRLAAWQAGETGLPFVDACMRCLQATGWMNFRMRSMLVAVASYHLWLDWRSTGPHLARMFLDYEPGIHWPQMQMQSGTTGINTLRVYNPVKQGKDQDPDGAFTRTWVPELASVPDAVLQEPWRWEGAGQLLGRSYPEPLVDPVTAARKAREAVWRLRQGPEFRANAKAIVAKHASRKGPGGFVRDRNWAPEGDTPAQAPKQLKLDL